jgi:K+-sensing histidine kinase KdpD
MTDNKLKTDYAPAERASIERLNHESKILAGIPLLEELLDSIPDVVLILNKQRQIVFANQTLVDVFDIKNRQEIYGLRPGEALDCIHSDENLSGCGTTSFCRTCGAVNTILSGLRGKKKTEECRISQKNNTAFDLSVSSTPFKNSDEFFVIFVAKDISHEKRRNVLERTFFHDISNILAGVIGYTSLLPLSPKNEHNNLLEKLSISVNQLQEEINAQTGLIAAESGDLSVNPVSIRSLNFLREISTCYKSSYTASSAQINLDDTSVDIIFVSDKTLLSRVVGNMFKNAIEASQSDELISTGCRLENDKYICFWVHNLQFMLEDVQLQVFNRSFSTKGKGRGTGTYSMKLLTERYLKGKITFSSNQKQGTIFSVKLPLILE